MNPATRLTAVLGIRYPVIQGGLAYLARAGLAAAVSNAGGLGQITATTLESPEALAAEIAEVRRLTSEPFGVNFAIGHRPIDDLLDQALDLKVPVVSLTGGNPAPYVDRIKARGARLMVLVAGVRAGLKAESLGADVVIGVGVEGGGHLGRDDIGTFVLTRRLVEVLRVPVVASGGIGDGRQLVAALALGAAGIEMGTRFVATQECLAHERYKAALVNAEIHETRVIERSLGRPGRALPSPHVDRILATEAEKPDFAALYPLISGEANYRAAVNGDMENGFAWAGQVAGLIHDIPSVAELFDRLRQEARQAQQEMCGWTMD
ncbi:2-nitropropane dioxygenase NPD [Sulfobacillus acidophilus TPY]|uniref:Probable nitronate monooxygenase n=1 Tax=Sulfobacillus acidophilus (strain ATCC 700253 / DSM 10332 / NAL) TaxID=679936 RepID=G8TSG1_SULAD|nr:2-nitropropane dioxygenase NPD [Sulfobacillus acidophilus TPY]AEW06653.1 2-nitropropane dioxygenase precursor [Sulfobacillus acidophilus DSM 10332]